MKLKLIILFFLITNILFAQNIEVEKEIMYKMETLRMALITKDSVALSKVLADDVTYGHTNAMIQTKAELIRDVLSLVQDYKQIDTSDCKIRLFEKTAIVNLNYKVIMNYKNYPLEMKMKAVLTWIKKDNDWILEARQTVKITD